MVIQRGSGDIFAYINTVFHVHTISFHTKVQSLNPYWNISRKYVFLVAPAKGIFVSRIEQSRPQTLSDENKRIKTPRIFPPDFGLSLDTARNVRGRVSRIKMAATDKASHADFPITSAPRQRQCHLSALKVRVLRRSPGGPPTDVRRASVQYTSLHNPETEPTNVASQCGSHSPLSVLAPSSQTILSTTLNVINVHGRCTLAPQQRTGEYNKQKKYKLIEITHNKNTICVPMGIGPLSDPCQKHRFL